MKRFSKMVSVTSAVPSAHAVERHELRLHVGGKTRVLGGAKALRLQTARSRLHPDQPSASDVDAWRRHPRSLSMTASRWSARAVAQQHVAAGRGHCAQKGAGLDAVGHHAGALAPCSRSTPWMRMRLLPWPSMRGAHGDQHLGQVGDFGLLRRRFPGRSRPRPSAAAIRRFSVPVTVTMSVAMRAPFRRVGLAPAGHHVAVLDRDLARPWRCRPLMCWSTGASRWRSRRAARHAACAKARQQRPQRQHRGAHGLDQLVRRFGRVQRTARSGAARPSCRALGLHAHVARAA